MVTPRAQFTPENDTVEGIRLWVAQVLVQSYRGNIVTSYELTGAMGPCYFSGNEIFGKVESVLSSRGT